MEAQKQFKQYQRTQIAEMRHVTEDDIKCYKADDSIPATFQFNVSISDSDRKFGSPRIGDMIARNPDNHSDQWLVNEQYFKDNFASLDKQIAEGKEIEIDKDALSLIIEDRIRAEQRKHSSLDWIKIASRKIAASLLESKSLNVANLQGKEIPAGAEAHKRIEFNINEYVYIQISERGWAYLKETVGNDYIKHCIESYKKVIDGEDWYKLQCHHVFDLFPVRNGNPVLFNTNILIEI